MASKGEISAAILRGNRDVQQVFGGLMDTQLDTRVQQGEGTWTAGDILGHLAGREQVYAMMFQAARGDNPFAAISDFNAWNEARVAERRGDERDDLLAEFRAVHEALLAQVEATDEAELAQGRRARGAAGHARRSVARQRRSALHHARERGRICTGVRSARSLIEALAGGTRRAWGAGGLKSRLRAAHTATKSPSGDWAKTVRCVVPIGASV